MIRPASKTIGNAIWVDPERMSGEPLFMNTRVPLKNLFDYLAYGHSVERFLEHFPGVSREQVEEVLALAAQRLIDRCREA